MSKELRCDHERDYMGNEPCPFCELEEVAAELKAGRERIEALEIEIAILADKRGTGALAYIKASEDRQHVEAARDKALADVGRLRKVLDTVRERCLFADDDGGIGVTEDAHIDSGLFDEICAALKETSGEQDG